MNWAGAAWANEANFLIKFATEQYRSLGPRLWVQLATAKSRRPPKKCGDRNCLARGRSQLREHNQFSVVSLDSHSCKVFSHRIILKCVLNIKYFEGWFEDVVRYSWDTSNTTVCSIILYIVLPQSARSQATHMSPYCYLYKHSVKHDINNDAE